MSFLPPVGDRRDRYDRHAKLIADAPPDVVEWIRTRPESVRALMRRFPPGALVRARQGLTLIAPGPGVVGEVVSYYESGTIGVLASLAAPLPTPTAGTLDAGTPIRGECRPDDLELVSDQPPVTLDLIRAIDEILG